RRGLVCQPIWVPSDQAMFDYLRQHQATFICCRTKDYPFGGHHYRADDTVANHPELFTPVLKSERTVLLRVHLGRIRWTGALAAATSCACPRSPQAAGGTDAPLARNLRRPLAGGDNT